MTFQIINIGLAIVSSFLVTYFLIPQILEVAYKKNIFDVPDERKLHTRQIPSLGGVAVFFGFLFSFLVLCPSDFIVQYKFVLSAYLLLFLVGLKDDLVPMQAKKKLLFQSFTALIVTFAGIKITSLYGFLGIYELSPLVSYSISIFFILIVMNAFNLIDGIDGLSGGLGIINCVVLGVLLFLIEEQGFAILAFALAGSLLAFLRFNFAAFPNKVFMGDTGSLILGLTASILCLQFMASPKANVAINNISPIVIVLGIIFIPVFDLFRVALVRMLRGRSPFSADNSHIHHELLDSGFNHKKASVLLYIANIIFIGTILFFKDQSSIQLILMLFAVGLILLQLVFRFQFQHRRTQLYRLKEKVHSLKRENAFISN